MRSRICSVLRITLLVAVLSMFVPGSAFCAGITLGWDPPDDSRVTGYYVYYGVSGTEYKNTPRKTISSRTQTSTGISDLEAGMTYWFVMTSFDAQGNESVFSEEVAYTVPVDTDGDGVPDASDLCPDDPGKTVPGACGCGVADTDTDGDGFPDCEDLCPTDPGKTVPGDCGCGVADTDSDGDGIPDCTDTGNGGDGSDPPAGGGDDGSDPPSGGENTPPEAPLLISPQDGAYDLGKQIVFETGGFVDADEDAHQATEWQIATDSGFADTLIMSRTEKNKKTQLSVTHVFFSENTTYYWRARYIDARDGVSPWSDINLFTTGDWGRDRNDNGIADANELYEAADLDSDGISDDQQVDMKSLQVINSNKQIGVKTPDGNRVKYIESLDPLQVEDQLKKPDSLPFGLIDFSLEVDEPGQTVTVTIHLSEAAPENARWYKYDGAAGWQDYSSRAKFGPARKSVEITLTDGGFGDADGVENGIIIDPGGPGIDALGSGDGGLKDASGSDGGGGGGSCFIRSLFSFF